LEDQNGFRRGRSTLNCIFTIKISIEKEEYNADTRLLFAYREKAFEKEIRLKLWTVRVKKALEGLRKAFRSL
jgi:hypothetical protein